MGCWDVPNHTNEGKYATGLMLSPQGFAGKVWVSGVGEVGTGPSLFVTREKELE